MFLFYMKKSVAGYVTEWKTKRYGARGGKTSKPNRDTTFQ